MKKILFALLITLAIHFPVKSQERVDTTKLPVLFRIYGQEKARVKKDIVYKTVDGKKLKMDVYMPSEKTDKMLPAVIFVSGASETKNWKLFTDYGELTAANGLISIQFNKRQGRDDKLETTREDIADLIKFIRDNAGRFGIDKDRLAVWSFSGGGLVLMSVMLPDQPYIRCLATYYGIGAAEREAMTEAAEKFPPILLVRAGLDRPNVNERIDLFVKDAIAKNIRLDFINYPDGRHAFDIFDDKPRTREIISKTFQFIREQMK